MRLLRLLATGLLATLLLPAIPAPAAEETCQGRPATHVTAPGQFELTGTEGDDVMVSNNASTVIALGGDDLVCVTGAGPSTTVWAGAGDDVVDASSASAGVEASLGAGRDHFTGSPFDDSVGAGPSGLGEGHDTDPDTIHTGAGTDHVVSGSSSRIPNGDVVVLGSGGDQFGGRVAWSGPMAPGARLDGGALGNTLSTDLAASRSSRVVVDNRSGTLTADGVVLLTWTRFDKIDLTGGPVPRSFAFTGSARDELVTLRLVDAHTGRQRIDLGEGDDDLWMGDDVIGAARSSYTGGPGADQVVLWADKSLSLDLASGRLETLRQRRAVLGRVLGFETHLVGARRLVLRGTRRSEELRFWGCTAIVRGRAGRDDIALSKGDGDFAVPPCRKPSIRLHGDGGDDLLRGTLGDDLLVGGRGRDIVSGNGGRDRCSGERLTSCEVRLRD